MSKAKAKRDVNRLKAIENGIETLLDTAFEVAGVAQLRKYLFLAQSEAKSMRGAIESYHDVEASVVLPFKPKGKK